MIIRRLLRCTRATAAVEAAIFAPIFLLFTLGITDLGSGMFKRMLVNAATQAGAIYAVAHSGSGSACASMTSACLTGIKAAMNDASGDPSFCTGTVCTASMAACADGPACIIVSASWEYAPFLPDVLYSWAQLLAVSYTTTVRIS
jgi:Flp pilus assembly protein TadG